MVTEKKLSGWGHPRNSPARAFTKFQGRSYITENRWWLDHLYRVREDGETVFVSEPYNVCQSDLRDLVRLEQEGWKVYVDGYGSHNDNTVRIRIWQDAA